MADIIIFDTMNVYARCYFVTTAANPTAEPTVDPTTQRMFRADAVASALKSIKMVAFRYCNRSYSTGERPQTKLYFTTDRDPRNPSIPGKASRLRIYPEYKAQRNLKDPMYLPGYDVLLDMLKVAFMGNIVAFPGYEADDLVRPLIERSIAENPEASVLLVSNDGDWCRNFSVSSHVSVLKGGEQYTPDMYQVKNGFYPTEDAIILWKSFKGDTSDNIPNACPRVPKKVLYQLIDNKYTVTRLLEDLKAQNNKDLEIKPDMSYIPANWQQRILESESDLLRNMHLVSTIPLTQQQLDQAMIPTQYTEADIPAVAQKHGFSVSEQDI